MNEQNRENFVKRIENGNIKSVAQAIKEADKIRAEKNASR